MPTTPAGLPPLAPLPTSPAFVLADPAWEYVVYFEAGGTATLDLIEATGALKMRWFNPRLGQFGEETTLTGGSYHTFTAPDKNDWCLSVAPLTGEEFSPAKARTARIPSAPGKNSAICDTISAGDGSSSLPGADAVKRERNDRPTG